MRSPYAFVVGAGDSPTVFFDPHPGAQLATVQRIGARVMRGTGPSKFFLRGNRGGGKSYLVRRGVLHALAMAVPGLRYVVVRRNMPDLRLNHLIYLRAEMQQLRGDKEGYNETHGTVTYPNGSMGFYRQCEDERDVEKIVGAEAAILFVDEAPQIKWDYLRTMAPSLRVAKRADGTQPCFIAEIYGGNPMGESIDELDHYFVDQDVSPLDDPSYNPADWCHIPIHRADNPSLDEAEYLKQFAGVPAAYRSAWVDGVRMESRTLFDVCPTITAKLLTHRGLIPRDVPLSRELEGKPYHYIQELPLVTHDKRLVPMLQVPWLQIYRTFDMGYYPDPAVCVWVAVVGRQIVAFHEETWFRTIAKDLAEKMIQTTTELVGDTPVANTFSDPDIGIQRGGDTITIRDTLELNGVPNECSIDDRVLYADAIHGLLGEEIAPGVPRFVVYEPGCPGLAKYLPKYRWDEKNARKFADHKFDHYGVCLAYFAISSGVLTLSGASEESQRPEWMDWMDESRGTRRVRRA